MAVPAQIGAYRVERLLGVGSFATVWLAHEATLDSFVAIKVLAENWSHDLRVRERFLDEGRLLRRLEHDRLVRVHTVGELPDGRPYLVLAWADRGSLRDRLDAGPLPVAAALWLLDQVAAGVAVLHRHGVVHRDLTPGNILFQSRPASAAVAGEPALVDERVLVADLGLAKALAAASGLTARAGTPGYMAPEQDDPRSVVDTRADVFGLGRLGLRLLAADPQEQTWAAGGSRAGEIVRLRAGVPGPVAEVLDRATAARPAARFADAAAFRAALRQATSPSPSASAQDTEPPRPDRAPPQWSRPGQQHRRGGRWRRPVRAIVPTLVIVLSPVGAVAADALPRSRTVVVPAGSAGPAGARITVALPAGWRSVGTRWADPLPPPVDPADPRDPADATDLPPSPAGAAPALVMAPQPRRWATESAMPGAFVGLPPGQATGAGVTPFLAGRVHAGCRAEPARRTRQADVDWLVLRFTCDRGKPVIVEAAGLAPIRSEVVYVQVTPPLESGPEFVDQLLAGVRVQRG